MKDKWGGSDDTISPHRCLAFRTRFAVSVRLVAHDGMWTFSPKMSKFATNLGSSFVFSPFSRNHKKKYRFPEKANAWDKRQNNLANYGHNHPPIMHSPNPGCISLPLHNLAFEQPGMGEYTDIDP